MRPPESRWPLVGRARELEAISQALNDTGGVVIVAPPGVGKSRLAREAFAAARTGGALAEWVQATSSAAAVPLGAFAALLPDHARFDEATAVMARSAEILTERAQGRRIVLAVDDAQLLDPVSAALVLQLVTVADVRVLATVRSGAPTPDAIDSLWKDAGAVRLDLEAFDKATARALAEHALGGPLDEAAARWLVERGGGNALFLSELLRGALDSGALTLDAGAWRLLREPQLSPTLRDLVRARLGALPGDQHAALELLALGEPLGIDELSELTEPEALVDAEAQGLVEVDAQDELRLAHPLFGDAVRHALPRLRARRIRLMLADTLARRSPMTGTDTLRVVRLRLDAGAEIPGELRLTAARAANLAGDPELGARLAELALGDGGGLAASMLLARAYTLRNRYAEAEAVLAAAEPAAALDTGAYDYVWQRIWGLQWGLRDAAAALALVERATAWPQAGDWSAQIEHARREVSTASQGFAVAVPDDWRDERSRPNVRAITLLISGRGEEAADIARTLRPPVPLREPSDAGALGTRTMVAVMTGNDWPATEAFMRDVLHRGVRANDHQAAGSAALSLGTLQTFAGRYRDSARWLTEAELHFGHQDMLGNIVHVRAWRVGNAIWTGDLDGALAALERMEATLDGREPLPNQLAVVLRARGLAARVRSDSHAVRLLRESVGRVAPVFGAMLAYDALRAGGRMAPELGELARQVDTRIVAAYAAHAQGRDAGDGTALLAAADRFAAIGAVRYAAEATADAAAAFLGDGRQDSARRAALRVQELHLPDQGAGQPEIEGLDPNATELTRRERQLTDLAASGLTNAEIADRLVLSVRTVESHIYHAMQKLGIGDRRDLR
jgi:DNA-binding CsgD family transcriptional regulator